MNGPSEDEAFSLYKRAPTSTRLSELLSLHQARAYNLCYQVLLRRQDAEDAAQDALIKVIERLPRIPTAQELRHWLYRFCLDRSLDLKRRKIRRQARELRYAMTSESIVQPSDGSQDEERSGLFRALQHVEDGQRSLIIEHYFERSSLDQIASREGVSKVAIWKRIEQARQTLRKALVTTGCALTATDPLSILEACQPVVLPTNLVPGAIAKAAAASALKVAVIGGTAVATKTTFWGLTACIATLALFIGGTAGYVIRRPTAEKVRELEARLGAAQGQPQNSRSQGASPRGVGTANPDGPRLAELESRVRDLQKAHDDTLRQNKELRDQLQAKKDSKEAQPVPLPGGFDFEAMITFFGIDDGSKANLKRVFVDTEGKLRQLEIEMAKVKTDGDNIRVEVPPFGASGEKLKEEWELHLSYVLSPSDLETYRKLKMGGVLFHNGFGDLPRLVELRREGDLAIIEDGLTESPTRKNRFSRTEGNDFASMRDYFKENYGYFLK